jgi:hypothetical protein
MLVSDTCSRVERLKLKLNCFFVVWVRLEFFVLSDAVHCFQLVGVVLWLYVLIIVILDGLLTFLLVEEVTGEQKLIVLLQELRLVNLVSDFEDLVDRGTHIRHSRVYLDFL